MAGNTIHCLGIAVLDALSGELEQYPVPRVHEVVVTERVSFVPGGGAVNTSGALARMGMQTAVFTKVGKDLMGSFLLSELETCGVNTSPVVISDHDTTPFTFVGIHPEGDRTFVHTPGANKTLCLQDIDVDRLLDCDVLLYQDLFAAPALEEGSGAELLRGTKEAGVVTVLDECLGLGPRREVLEPMLCSCDYFLPSLDDLRVLYPDDSPGALARRMLDLGARTVILKMGTDGCLLVDGDGRLQIPAFEARVVDTTGAGDCWDAGFLAALVHEEPKTSAAAIGNACAAFCIESVGGATGVPTYAEVVARVNESDAAVPN